MIQWLSQAFPMARAWIGTLYRDLHCPPATLHSLDPAYFAELSDCLDDNMLFVRVPSGTAVPLGSRLLGARHIPMRQRQDLHKVLLSGKRVWLRVADPAAPTRKLSERSIAFLKFWQRWCRTPGIQRASEAPRRATIVAAADAMGQGPRFAIGGFLRFASCVIWFSEGFEVADFAFASLTLSSSASDDISCYECLAQIALLHCASAVTSSGRLHVRIPSWTDNTGAEAVANKLYTSRYPLCMFAQRLALFSCFTAMELDTTHISGPRNELADWLSRWNGTDPLPNGLDPAFRIPLDLRQLWHRANSVALFPAQSQLDWSLPQLELLQ